MSDARSAFRARVDPELAALLDAFPVQDLTDEALAQARRVAPQRSARETAASHPGYVVAPGAPGSPEVAVLVSRPASRTASGPSPALLHLHGGGFILCRPHDFAALNQTMADEQGCVVLSVDYRLAPETRAPGAVEDGYAALVWAAARAEALGIDAARIGVLGESAGGGLAAGVALMARDLGGPRLAFQHLVQPMLDDRTAARADAHPLADQLFWNAHNNRFCWRAWLGREPGGEGVDAYAAPARAVDLSGLPPTFLSVGDLDLFADETLAYARRLLAAGVPTELHLHPGGFHGFDSAPDAALAETARRLRREALARAFRPGPAAAI